VTIICLRKKEDFFFISYLKQNTTGYNIVAYKKLTRVFMFEYLLYTAYVCPLPGGKSQLGPWDAVTNVPMLLKFCETLRNGNPAKLP
jgi:hypothetical protein